MDDRPVPRGPAGRSMTGGADKCLLVSMANVHGDSSGSDRIWALGPSEKYNSEWKMAENGEGRSPAFTVTISSREGEGKASFAVERGTNNVIVETTHPVAGKETETIPNVWGFILQTRYGPDDDSYTVEWLDILIVQTHNITKTSRLVCSAKTRHGLKGKFAHWALDRSLEVILGGDPSWS